MRCPACGAPLETRRLDDAVEVHACPSCAGVYYDAGQLAVRLEIPGAVLGERLCPKDSQKMVKGIVKGSQVEVDGCTACGSVWLDAGEVQKLRAALGVDQLVGGKRPSRPPPLPVPGVSTARPARAKERPKPGQSAEPLDSANQANPDQARKPSVEHAGRRYDHFQTSWPSVTYVVGEFPWQVKVGDQAKTRDFICPPYLLSEELTAADRTWSHGEYVDGAEVWAGFALEGEPPARKGTAPNQPNPRREAWDFLKVWSLVAAAAAVALYAGLSSRALRKEVLAQGFAYDLRAVGERSFVTPVFELEGRPSSVQVSLNTNLDNGWAFFHLSLINAETDVALDFEREVSYYHGYEDGESWGEGTNQDTVTLPRVPGGRYYLRVEPESESSFSYDIHIVRDVPRLLHLFIALAVLLGPLFWVGILHHVFEVSRWAESDHPKTSSSDDDDD